MGFDAFAKLESCTKAPVVDEMKAATSVVNERERRVARTRGRAGGVLPGMMGECRLCVVLAAIDPAACYFSH